MAREMKNSASREQSHAGMNSAEAQPILERKLKDSGVKWIGEIPSHWICSKQKYLITLLNGRAYKDSEFEEDGKYKILRVGNLFTNPTWYTSSLELEPNKYCQDGDLLYSWSMSYAPVIWHGEKVIFHYHIWKTILSEKICKMFAYYYFISLTNALRSEIHETTMGFITMGIMNNASIALPPLSEQHAIADFLDTKCAEIDGLLADLDAEVKTLAEYKKSIIAEAVTHGLNPNAPMKQSGIPWAETIPAHWDLHPVYHYFSQRIHKNIFGNEQNLLSLSFGKIIRKDINTVGGLLPASYNTYNIVEAGDIIIRPTDLQNDKRSLRTGLVTEHGIITSAYIALKPNSTIHPPYFHYLLHSYDIKKVFYNMGNGVRQGLNYSEFSRLMLFEPPIEEQEAIATYLDEKCAIIDQSITDKQMQIETLKSYKSSLIYEYVTGKKQVI